MEKNSKKINDPITVDLKNMLDILKKRKWWFLGTFIVVLIFGLIYTFFIARNSIYSAKTLISMSRENLEYQELIVNSYPEYSSKLWLIEDRRYVEFHSRKYINLIPLELESESLLNNVSNELNELNMNLDVNNLKRLIRVEVTHDENYLYVSTFYSDPEGVVKINNVLLDTYFLMKEKEFEKVYNELLDRVNPEVYTLEEKLSQLSDEAENYVLEFNKQLIRELKEKEQYNIEFTATDFITPELENKINDTTKKYNSLKNIRDNMINNKDLYTQRFKINSGPEVQENLNYFRNILLSIAAAAAVGIIAVYFVGFIINVKKK